MYVVRKREVRKCVKYKTLGRDCAFQQHIFWNPNVWFVEIHLICILNSFKFVFNIIWLWMHLPNLHSNFLNKYWFIKKQKLHHFDKKSSLSFPQNLRQKAELQYSLKYFLKVWSFLSTKKNSSKMYDSACLLYCHLPRYRIKWPIHILIFTGANHFFLLHSEETTAFI